MDRGPHVTAIDTLSVCAKPPSPSHVKVSVPVTVATVKKAMNGLAEIAGYRSAAKTSTPS